MKVVKINESQKERLFEAYREGFEFDTLSYLGDERWFYGQGNDIEAWEKQFDYCKKWLGEPFGFGSSRCVFTLNDSIILKLAIGSRREGGIEQNRIEYTVYQKYKSPLLATVFDCDENFSYIVCENVVPCVENDFLEVLGIPFFGTSDGGFCVNDVLTYIENNYSLGEEMFDMRIEVLINRNPWFKELKELIENTGMCDLSKAVENFGMVNRNGKPSIVILDAGFNMEVYNKYYVDNG